MKAGKNEYKRDVDTTPWQKKYKNKKDSKRLNGCACSTGLRTLLLSHNIFWEYVAIPWQSVCCAGNSH